MPDKDDRIVTVRKSLEEALHCVRETLRGVELNIDPRGGIDDVKHVYLLRAQLHIQKGLIDLAEVLEGREEGR